ncbi:uncharacterized protein LOC100550180 isoform X2 [Meleagris gallopavo]|uniref:uncharacterized protein LOC100550180 isoform X2 n=1 Tax=Meleagris gallopavo TaxID=9103 RepID=UPI00093DB3A8|nr:uncharacterized protein LOC100550180 isoform X2 [Meleagris gallopavo]
MFMHVCGSKHRLAYLKQHYPEIAESDEVKGKGSELNRKVRQVALTIEKKEGRKQLKVVIEAPVIRKRWQEYSNADDSPSKAKVQHVDTSLSNEEGMDCKNKDGKLPDLIQEEKNVQEEQEHCQNEQAIPDEKVETNTAVESTEGDLTEEGSSSEKCETNVQLQEENEEVEQASAAAAEEFTSQEELLSYLDFLDNECNGEEALEHSTEQSELTSADISDSDTDNSSSRSAKKSLSINEEDELQNFSTGSLDTAYENNVTAEFLNSVRNMNVEEVTATLHKIAATNPAFRGMDIPNVVKILTESGTLRRLSNGSTH